MWGLVSAVIFSSVCLNFLLAKLMLEWLFDLSSIDERMFSLRVERLESVRCLFIRMQWNANSVSFSVVCGCNEWTRTRKSHLFNEWNIVQERLCSMLMWFDHWSRNMPCAMCDHTGDLFQSDQRSLRELHIRSTRRWPMLWLVQSNEQYDSDWMNERDILDLLSLPFRNRALYRARLAHGESHWGWLRIDRAHRSAAMPWHLYIRVDLPVLFACQGDDATGTDVMSTRRKQCDHHFHATNVLREDRIVCLSRMCEERLRGRYMRLLSLNMIFPWLKISLQFYSSSEISFANGFESEATFPQWNEFLDESILLPWAAHFQSRNKWRLPMTDVNLWEFTKYIFTQEDNDHLQSSAQFAEERAKIPIYSFGLFGWILVLLLFDNDHGQLTPWCQTFLMLNDASLVLGWIELLQYMALYGTIVDAERLIWGT